MLTNGTALFTPGEGTWNLKGIASASGEVTAERTVIGADKKPYVTRLSGQWTPTRATGTYITPRCTYALEASKA